MTTLTAVYTDDLARIRLSATGLSGSAVIARFEWSADAIRWFIVRGGIAVPVMSSSALLDHYEFTTYSTNRYRVVELDGAGAVLATTTTATGAPMDRVWLKVPSAPYANQPVTLVGWTEIERDARSGVFAVAGRREPIAVSELHIARRVTVLLRAADDAETTALDLVLSLGLPIHLHVPASCALPTMHAVVGRFTRDRPTARSRVGRFTVPLTEIAAPDLSLAGYTVTYPALTRLYATYADLASAHATYASILTLRGSAIDALDGS